MDQHGCRRFSAKFCMKIIKIISIKYVVGPRKLDDKQIRRMLQKRNLTEFIFTDLAF